MIKPGEQVQVKWKLLAYSQGAASHAPFIVEPKNVHVQVDSIDGAPEPREGDEWLCEAILDERPVALRNGTQRLRFLKSVREEWVFLPRSPKLYGKQLVEARYMRGLRTIEPRPKVPKHIRQAVARTRREFEAAHEKAGQDLAPFMATAPGPGAYRLEIDLPGLKGRLRSDCDGNPVLPGKLRDPSDCLPRQEDDCLYRVWTFRDQAGECAVGRTPIATGLGPGRAILDIGHTLAELGQPSCVEHDSGHLVLFWRKRRSTFWLSLYPAADLPELGILGLDPLRDALGLPEIGPMIEQAMGKMEGERQADERRLARLDETELANRGWFEREIDSGNRPQPPREPNLSLKGPATVETLKAWFNKH